MGCVALQQLRSMPHYPTNVKKEGDPAYSLSDLLPLGIAALGSQAWGRLWGMWNANRLFPITMTMRVFEFFSILILAYIMAKIVELAQIHKNRATHTADVPNDGLHSK